MAKYLNTVWCDGCGVEILWSPVMAAAREYCCELCRDGLACQCSDRADPDQGRRARSAEGGEAVEEMESA